MKFIEVFNTWQGEGPDVGKRMLLCRFKECDRVEKGISCNYCDTLIKMRVSLEADYTIDQISKPLFEEKLGLLITGGEPTYKDNLYDTIDLIRNFHTETLINVETNGYGLKNLFKGLEEEHYFSSNGVKFILSPKMFDEDDVLFYKDLVDFIETSLKYSFVYYKLVYMNGDWNQINDYNDLFLQYLFENSKYKSTLYDRIYLMPEGKTREELLQNAPIVFDKCEEWKVNFSSREHIIYGFI
jgi:organic radical activating enzyme